MSEPKYRYRIKDCRNVVVDEDSGDWGRAYARENVAFHNDHWPEDGPHRLERTPKDVTWEECR